MRPILITSGEPAGIGPDLCLKLAKYALPCVILGDKKIFEQRAQALSLRITFNEYKKQSKLIIKPDNLTILSLPCPSKVVAGKLSTENSQYVLEMLNLAAKLCSNKEFSALVTAPVHKGIINQAGFNFTGHTEYFADFFKVKRVVMMLAAHNMKVALVTTHIPLKEVSAAINKNLIIEIIECLNSTLKQYFAIDEPKIFVAGLNPHAGESGYLGREEIDEIIPALDYLQKKSIKVYGPMPADSMFTENNIKECDVFLAMYHDQGLPVLKAYGFGHGVNITLGLPIIRVSVDHGTALDLAGSGLASELSLLEAIKFAKSMTITKR